MTYWNQSCRPTFAPSSRPRYSQPRAESVLVNHYKEELDSQNPPQLLVNCDGKGWDRQNTHLLQMYGYLGRLAEQQGLPSPILCAAPTGVAAFNFFGRTLQSFKLPIRGNTWGLSLADLTGLQATQILDSRREVYG
jgi:hypothetical protein